MGEWMLHSFLRALLVPELELAGREEVLCAIQLRKVVAHKLVPR